MSEAKRDESEFSALLSVGDTVCLRPDTIVGHVPKGRENHKTAKIQAILTDINGGLFMDRDLHGCRYWNVENVLKLDT